MDVHLRQNLANAEGAAVSRLRVPLLNSRGSFLVSVMMYTVLFSILLASGWKLVMSRQDQMSKVKTFESRDTAAREALRNSRVATYYYYTLLQNNPLNADFMNCMIDDGLGNDCVALDGMGIPIVHQVRLVDDTNTLVLGPDLANPVYYDIYGRVCPTPSEECLFDVYGDYTVTCETGAATCPQALEITMTVYVRVHPGFEDPQFSMAPIQLTQTISISNFRFSHHPILPPPTPYGTPIAVGAGPGGYIVNLVNSSTSTTSTTSTTTTTTSTSTSTTLPLTVIPCGPGETALPNGTCGTFGF